MFEVKNYKIANNKKFSIENGKKYTLSFQFQDIVFNSSDKFILLLNNKKYTRYSFSGSVLKLIDISFFLLSEEKISIKIIRNGETILEDVLIMDSDVILQYATKDYVLELFKQFLSNFKLGTGKYLSYQNFQCVFWANWQKD